jgi:outer membrane lipoprotein-sorting protein
MKAPLNVRPGISINRKNALAAGLIGLVPALAGCMSHTRIVPRTHLAELVISSSLDQLVDQVNTKYNDIQTMKATVEISATTGSSLQGHLTESPSFSGYIFLRKPEDLRVILLVPVLRNQAMDMVSDGKTWKLWIPPRNRAMEGTSQVTKPSKNGLENLRPAVFFDSLLVRGPEPNEIASLTSDIRLVADPKRKKDLVEEPDYDLQVLSQPQGQTAHTHRVIHISRTNLLPYQQDIYDDSGDVVTRAVYSNYQNYGDIPFPSKIVITRPIDQYSLTVTITKLTLNQKLDNDQFEMKIPDTVPIQKMD